MNNWNLRRVIDLKRGERVPRIREVFYDEKSLPWTYTNARIVDTIRFIKDWINTPVLKFDADFIGEPEWLADLQKMAEDEKMKEKAA